MVDAHIDRDADITIAAQPVDRRTSDRRWASSASTASGQIVAFEEKPNAERLAEIGASVPAGAAFTGHNAGEAVRRVDGHLRVLAPGAAGRARRARHRLRTRDHPGRARRDTRCNAYLLRGYWADVGTVESFYDANIMLTRADAPFQFYDSRRPIYTHPRFLPASRLDDCARARRAHRRRVLRSSRRTIEQSVVGMRDGHRRGQPASRARCCSAPTSTKSEDIAPSRGSVPPLGIGTRRRARSRDRGQERAHRRRRRAWSTSAACRKPTATATTSATASSSCPRTASLRRDGGVTAMSRRSTHGLEGSR